MADPRRNQGETDLIQTYFAPLTVGAPGAFGLTDDCASLTPPNGMDLVLSTDAVISGVHFLANDDPAAIAWKVLAANVSDIVAKGARPHVYLMNLSLPAAPTKTWLEAFSSGLCAAQTHFQCCLTGGDTDKTTGPLSVSMTLVGLTPRGQMVRRGTARPGDVVFVTGPIGDATLGLRLAQDGGAEFAKSVGLSRDQSEFLEAQYRRPQPNIAVADVLVGRASAAMDVSDGLIRDFGRMCAASGCGGHLDLRQMPVSGAAKAVLSSGAAMLVDLATGGEDYVVLGCIREDRLSELVACGKAADVPIAPLGRMQIESKGIQVFDESGQVVSLARTGWDHFSE